MLKGDLVNRASEDEYDLLDKVLAEAGLPAEAIPGNHEVKSYREVDHADAFARIGLTAPDGIRAVDLPGLRLVLVDSAAVGAHGARIEHAIPRLGEAIDGRPALVVLHHHLLPVPISTYWPPGVPSPLARRFVAAVAEASPAAIIASGHSHRHRMRRHGHVVVTETGSPKDYPGTWTGYVVHEGGIRQVVHRVARPDVLAWTEHTRRAAAGALGPLVPRHPRPTLLPTGLLEPPAFGLDERWQPRGPGPRAGPCGALPAWFATLRDQTDDGTPTSRFWRLIRALWHPNQAPETRRPTARWPRSGERTGGTGRGGR